MAHSLRLRAGPDAWSSSARAPAALRYATVDSKRGPHVKQAPKATRGNGVSAAPVTVKDNSDKSGSTSLGSPPRQEGRQAQEPPYLFEG